MMKKMSWFVVFCLVCSGCKVYTQPQKDDIDKMEQNIFGIGRELLNLGKSATRIAANIKEVEQAAAEGKIPYDEMVKLTSNWKAEQKRIFAAMDAFTREEEKFKENIEELRAQGIGGWQLAGIRAWGVVSTVLCLGYRVKVGRIGAVARGLSSALDIVKGKAYEPGLTKSELEKAGARMVDAERIRRE